MTEEERGHSKMLVYQLLPSRYGMNPDDLRRADAIEIVVGQGAKPGGGGMLLGPEDLGPRGRDARPAEGDRPAERLPAPGLDRAGRPRDQDRRAARDHRLGEADLHQGRRDAPVLRHRPGGESWGGCRGDGRDARWYSGHSGCVHRARRHPDPRRHPPRRRRAAGPRRSPRGPADRLRGDPQRRRCGEGSRPRRRCGLHRRGGADRARATTRPSWRTATRSSAPRPASTTTGTRAATRPASRPRTSRSPRASTPSSAAAGSRTTCAR